MLMSRHGLTMIEIIAASVIGSLVAAGTLSAFVAAVKISTASSNKAEAGYLIQQTFERLRDKIACSDDGSTWFDAGCNQIVASAWTDDPLSVGTAPSVTAFGATRQYQVTPQDCDADGAPGDCFQVVTTLHWNPPQ